MKIAEALSQARKDLDSKGVSNSKLDSLVLLTHTFFMLKIPFSKEQIIFNPNFELSDSQQETFFELIQRRAKREPVSHILGKREFFGEDFIVSSDVLDPRPDSETLIELVLKIFPDKNAKLKILELGVGSGCLIITLLKALKNAEAIAIDISQKALEICQKNTANHQVQNRLKLLKSNLFEALNSSEKFDLIISNPPYIASIEIEDLEPEVKIYEPKTALDGGLDGLDFYRKIAAAAENFLQPKAKIILEIGYNQHQEITKIFTEKNFILTASELDLSGVVRVLCFEIK
jgi:release factor glutamine methyltransferase